MRAMTNFSTSPPLQISRRTPDRRSQHLARHSTDFSVKAKVNL
jgi:hypothetical protein